MGSYISYIIDGIWEAKQCILLGIILWLLWNLILFSLKKRSGEKLKKYGFKYLFCELLLVIYQLQGLSERISPLMYTRFRI